MKYVYVVKGPSIPKMKSAYLVKGARQKRIKMLTWLKELASPKMENAYLVKGARQKKNEKYVPG